MRRREFITLLGGAAAWPLVAVAQQSAIPTIGFLRSTLPDASTDLLVALSKGLKETGYVEGQNITIEYRWAENRHERLSALAADLVHQRCVVIMAGGVDATFAAKAATTTIPIIFATGVTRQERPSGQSQPAGRQCHRRVQRFRYRGG
jgi:putative ABC transport system substrate-binding protein